MPMIHTPPLPHVSWDGKAHTIDVDKQLKDMVTAYLEACLFFDKPEEENWDGKFFNKQVTDLAYFECAAFLHLAKWEIKGWTMEQLGHDFWLTRNHHGTGFWDRDISTQAVREKLTKLAHTFGEVSPYLGDDGTIYYA